MNENLMKLIIFGQFRAK